jgi:hypothetical protein
LDFSLEPEAFAEQISQGNLTSEQILLVLDEHDHIWLGCPQCDYISEDLGEGHLPEFLVSSNPTAVNAEVIDRCVKHLTDNYDFNNGGYEEGVAFEFATNPNSSAETLSAGALYMEMREIIETRFEGEPYPEEDFKDELKTVAAHPLADEPTFRKWLAAGHDPRTEMEESLHPDSAESCATCLGYLEEIWLAR